MIAIDISMPKNCDECCVRFNGAFFNSGICDHFQNDDHDGGRNHECPLIEVTHITDKTVLHHRLIEDISPDGLNKYVKEIHALRMAKFIFEHQELIRTTYDDDVNDLSRQYATDSYVVNINKEAKDGKADNQ